MKNDRTTTHDKEPEDFNQVIEPCDLVQGQIEENPDTTVEIEREKQEQK